ncbi:MAG: fumarylacetoacetate hydrolase family protein [Mycetocola sp.]
MSDDGATTRGPAEVASVLGTRPGKVVAVHINYPSRAAERGRTPAFPSYFLKPSTSLAASGEPVERPAGTELLGFEGEIALVIGTTARRIAVEDAWSAVSGVTAANDLGVYDLRHADKGSNLRSKGGDGFTPVGPSVLPAAGLDPAGIRVRAWLNGELVQSDTTADLLFPFAQLVSDLSQLITLEPGDLILTGTPAGASVAQPGDVIEVEVDSPGAPGSPSTGRLVTPVSAGAIPLPPESAQPQVDDVQREEAWGSADAAGLEPTFRSQPQIQEIRVDTPYGSALVPACRPNLLNLEGVERGIPEDLERMLRSVGTATLSSQLRARGYPDVSIDGVTPLSPGTRLVGRARTLRFIPYRPDLFAGHGGGFNAQKRAFDGIGPGEVLVIDARGERGTGTVGDILALRAQVRGAAGIVTDGGVRDSDAVRALGLPVYSAGPHPAALGRRHVPWETDVTIACGGAAVQPGDIVVGDADGVLVLPPALAREVAEAAVQQELEETFIAEQVAAGVGIDGLYPMNAAWREEFARWRSTR